MFTTSHVKQIFEDFFETMPTFNKEEKVVCEKCNTENKIMIDTVFDFF